MWPKSNRPLVLLAPMSGLTDSPFRRFIKRLEPRCVVFTEFLSARRLCEAKSSISELTFHKEEHPIVVQLFGKNPREFRQAAQRAEEHGAAGIDINMGCPAKKVVAHQHGSMLMQDLALAAEIVACVKTAVSIPVSVKTRLGWHDDSDLVRFCRCLEGQGLDAMTLHGRTYAQKFSGRADWASIYDVKQHLSIPVFGNGDIASASEARNRLKSLDGVMIGRAAIAHPHLIKEVCSLFYDDHPYQADLMEVDRLAADWLVFAKLSVASMPEWVAAQRFRKFLLALAARWQLPCTCRQAARRVSSLTDIAQALSLFAQSKIAQATHKS